MICIINEKPSQARNFAKALGGQKGIYDKEQFEIVASVGHLFGYVDPVEQVPLSQQADYQWIAGIDVLPWNHKEFAWKRELGYGKADVLKKIKECAKRSTEICIATDDDPTGEGSLIAWEILEELGLDTSGKKITRMFFADEAAVSIQNAFKNRKTFASKYDDPDYKKAIFRSRFDFLTMQFTRIATSCGDGSVLRQGRLKSPMVQIVGDGLRAVKAYKKIPFYQNRFRDENGNLFIKADEPMFPSKTDVPQMYQPSSITMRSKDLKHTAPPKLIDLADLSARLASQGYKAKDVLATYQKMYENQIVSYPRTEDKHITPEQFKELLPKATLIAKVVGVNADLLVHTQMRKTHVKTGCAHGANRPGNNVPTSLQALANAYGDLGVRIYTILATSYLAMLCADYEYISEKGCVSAYPAFIGSATIPHKLGWRQVFNDTDDDVESSTKGLGMLATPFIYEGFPPKPPTPTMKWLMRQLEKHDVGTGATRTSVYGDLTSAKTVKNKYPLMADTRGKITLTEFGDMSYHLIQGTRIADVMTTEMTYTNMRQIAEEQANEDELLTSVADMVVSDRATMRNNIASMEAALGIKQGQRFIKKEKTTGMFGGKEVTFNRIWGGYTFTDSEVTKLLDGEEITIQVTGKDGRPYAVTGQLGKGEYAGRSFIGFQKKQTNQSADPDKVTAMFEGQQITFRRVWGSYRFNDMEIAELLKGNIVNIAATGQYGPYVVSGRLAQGSFKGRKYWGFQMLPKKKK